MFFVWTIHLFSQKGSIFLKFSIHYTAKSINIDATFHRLVIVPRITTCFFPTTIYPHTTTTTTTSPHALILSASCTSKNPRIHHHQWSSVSHWNRTLCWPHPFCINKCVRRQWRFHGRAFSWWQTLPLRCHQRPWEPTNETLFLSSVVDDVIGEAFSTVKCSDAPLFPTKLPTKINKHKTFSNHCVSCYRTTLDPTLCTPNPKAKKTPPPLLPSSPPSPTTPTPNNHPTFWTTSVHSMVPHNTRSHPSYTKTPKPRNLNNYIFF